MNGPGSTGRTEKRPRRTPRSSPRRSRRGYRRPAPRCRGRAGAAPQRGPARDAAGAHTGSSQRAGPGAAGQSRPRTWKGLSGSTAGPPCWAMAAPGPGAEPPPSPPRLTAPRRRLAAAPTTSPAPLGAPESRTAGRPAHARGRAESGEQVMRSRGRSHVEARTLPPHFRSRCRFLRARPAGSASPWQRRLHGNGAPGPARQPPAGPGGITNPPWPPPGRQADTARAGPSTEPLPPAGIRAQVDAAIRARWARRRSLLPHCNPGRTAAPGGYGGAAVGPEGCKRSEEEWVERHLRGQPDPESPAAAAHSPAAPQQQHSSARSCLHPLGTAEPHTATDPTLQPPPSGLPSGLGRCSAFCVLLFTLG